jgi:DNA-binding MarR family transcriptional regulator
MTTASNLFISHHLLHSKLIKKMDASLSIHGISFTEYHVLFHLSKALNHTMSRIDLARSVELSASGVTRLIAPMEKLGLVDKEKHPRDARKSLVKLSEAGRRIFEESSIAFNDVANTLFNSLSENQIVKMEKLCSEVYQ